MISREELFELAASPLGSKEMQQEADRYPIGAKGPGYIADVARRCSKKWLPEGKKPVNGREIREAEAAAKALNFDIEDAIAAAGGSRGFAN